MAGNGVGSDVSQLAPIVAVVVVLSELMRAVVASVVPSRSEHAMRDLLDEVRNMSRTMTTHLVSAQKNDTEVLAYVKELYDMHKHTDSNGRPSWYVPSSIKKSVENMESSLREIEKRIKDQ